MSLKLARRKEVFFLIGNNRKKPSITLKDFINPSVMMKQCPHYSSSYFNGLDPRNSHLLTVMGSTGQLGLQMVGITG